MPWWGWIVIGTLLFCAELFAIDAQFYLIFVGAGALVVGLTELSGIALPSWGQWLLFAVLSVVSMVTFRGRLYGQMRGGMESVPETMVGQRLVLKQQLQPGAACRTEYRGTTWTAINVGTVSIPSGGNATIEAMDGLTLKIRIPSN